MEPKQIPVAWAAHRDAEFVQAVVDLCHAFGWPETHPGWLMACMAFESGGTFSPSVKNMAGSGAVGLIQFMPSTAEGLGTTTENLELLSATGQLFYVGRYFRPYAERIETLADMYMAILMPKYVGEPDDAVLFSGGIAYRQNSGLDADHDGKITKAEAAGKVQHVYEQGMQLGNVGDVAWEAPA